MFINYIKLLAINIEIRLSLALLSAADAIKQHAERSINKIYP